MASEITKAAIVESKRIRQFRLDIAKIIPKFPNNQTTLDMLEAKSVGDLLTDYLNWACRLIKPRPRKIHIEPTLTADKRWRVLAADTKVLLDRARNGDNLNPNLSLRVFRNGFTPATSIADPNTDKWEDKDFFLNTIGYHHLHLSQVIETGGHAKRTDDVLFAQITKDTFYAIGFFDHSVFEFTDSVTNTMTAERERLWSIYEQRNSLGRKPGGVYISNPITSSGHSLQRTMLADDFARVIHEVDPKLDDLASRAEIFSNLPHETVKKMKLKWHLDFMNLGLLDKTSNSFYILKYGES